MQSLKQIRSTLESEIAKFIEDKAIKSCIEEEKLLSFERDDFTDMIRTQIAGTKEIIESLKTQSKLILAKKMEGKGNDAKKIWQERVGNIREFIDEMKSNFNERYEYLSQCYYEIQIPIIKIDDDCPDADSFIDNLPTNVPG